VSLNVLFISTWPPLWRQKGLIPSGLCRPSRKKLTNTSNTENIPLHFRTLRENNTVYQYFLSVASAKFVQADLQTTSSDGLQDLNTRANWVLRARRCGPPRFTGEGKPSLWIEPGSVNRESIENGRLGAPFCSSLRREMSYNTLTLLQNPITGSRVYILRLLWLFTYK